MDARLPPAAALDASTCMRALEEIADGHPRSRARTRNVASWARVTALSGQ